MPEEEAEILQTDDATFKITESGTIKVKQKGGLRRRDPKGRFIPKEIVLDESLFDFSSKMSQIMRGEKK